MLKSLEYKIIGSRIRTLRHLQGLTQEQLSEKADINKNYLSDLERAKSAGSLDVFYRIASALHISLDFLIDLSVPVDEESYLIHKIQALESPKQKLLEKYVDFLEHLKLE